MIKDSGNRREFESGAVRDMAEGKGRCDLMPLLEVGHVLDHSFLFHGEYHEEVFECFILLNMCSDEKRPIEDRYDRAIDAIYEFSTMANVSIPDLMLEVAIHYEEGAKKYSERNWEKGLPTWCFIDSAVRHLLKYLGGRTDERHDRAFVWNMLGFAYTIRKLDEERRNHELQNVSDKICGNRYKGQKPLCLRGSYV